MINDLFSGNSDEYNSFIQSVNNANGQMEAESIMEESSINNHWNQDNETYLILKSFVTRRFL